MNCRVGIKLGYKILPVLLIIISFYESSGAGEIPAMPVEVAKAVAQTIPVTLEGSGHVEAYSSIAVKSRVDGKLEKVLVEDGALVKQGEQLFEIDTVPYKLAVHKAQADLRRETATSVESGEMARISKKLYSSDVVAKEKMDQQQALAEEAMASVDAARAELETARQNLEYCKIIAPIDGILGRKLINEGNLIAAYQDVIITLDNIDKLKVLFSLPARDLRTIKKYQRGGALEVIVTSSEDQELKLEGQINFIASTIDNDTGMFEIQALLDNPQHELWPGEFVNVSVILTTRPDSIVIPQRALINGADGGKMVYIIKDNKAEPRPVKEGWELEDNRAVIMDGIKDGEVVAIGGLFKLYPGAMVKVVSDNKQK